MSPNACSFLTMSRDQVLMQAWGFGCLIVGSALILTGARAAGLAVLGSIVGSVVGEFVAPSFDALAYSTVFGATIGTVVFGLAGLFWRSPAKRPTLLVLAGLVALLGVVAVFGIPFFWGGGCFYSPKGRLYTSCLPAQWDYEMQMLFVLNAAFVALLCLAQPARRERDDLRATASAGMPDPRTMHVPGRSRVHQRRRAR
jgi:hypothetical protein